MHHKIETVQMMDKTKHQLWHLLFKSSQVAFAMVTYSWTYNDICKYLIWSRKSIGGEIIDSIRNQAYRHLDACEFVKKRMCGYRT